MLKAVALYRDGSKLSQPLKYLQATGVHLNDPNQRKYEAVAKQAASRVLVRYLAKRRPLPTRRSRLYSKSNRGRA